VHAVIPLAMSYNWNNGAALQTLILPLGFFIVVMAALYFVFARPHTVPGRRPIAGARPVAPDPQTARDMTAAVGFGTAPSAGGKAPLADRGTPPAVGVRTDEALQAAAQEAAEEAKAPGDKVAGESGQDENAATEDSEDQE
jgi:hypothetical protein